MSQLGTRRTRGTSQCSRRSQGTGRHAQSSTNSIDQFLGVWPTRSEKNQLACATRKVDHGGVLGLLALDLNFQVGAQVRVPCNKEFPVKISVCFTNAWNSLMSAVRRKAAIAVLRRVARLVPLGQH